MAGESADEAARRMRAKSERLARTAELWERGAEGERHTAAVLDTLPKGEWTVFHDLRWPGRRFANVDHVVVGPPGVFVIDTKNWSGTVVVRAGVLRQNGRSREPAVANASEAAIAVSLLTRIVGPHDVHPVLCFVQQPDVAGRARDVMVCSTANLATMLQTRRGVLSVTERIQLCLDLDASFRSALERSTTTARPASRRSEPPARAPRSGRSATVEGRRILRRAIGAAMILAGLWVVGTTEVLDDLGRLVASITQPDG